jgi:hypothetical protein
MNKTRKVSIKIITVILSVAVTLMICEIIIRTLYRKKIMLFPRYHTNIKYGNYEIRRIRPNSNFVHRSIDGTFHFRTNNMGFRNDRDINYKKAENTIRILCLGDSHTQGYEVNQEEPFSNICEQYLKQKKINVEVINAGVSGFGTAEQLVFLENEGYKYNPDFVVIGFYANDFTDNVKSNLFKLENDTLVNINFRHVPGVKLQNKIYKFGIFRFLGENSYLYGFAFNTLWDFYKKRLLIKGKKKVVVEYAIPVRELNTYDINLCLKLMQRINNFCKIRDIKLIILDIPKKSMEPSIPENYLDLFKYNCDTLLYTNDLIDEFRQLKYIYLPRGYHISSSMHKLYGEKIGEYVLQQLPD